MATHLAGIRVTVLSADPVTQQVTINITMYTDLGLNPIGGVSPMGLPPATPAIDWGDGVTVANTNNVVVTAAPAGSLTVYRRSFSHTYPDTTARTIRVSTFCCGGPTATFTLVTGNPILGVSGGGAPSVQNITNMAGVVFMAVPALPTLGLWLLAAMLGTAGFVLLRQKKAQTT